MNYLVDLQTSKAKRCTARCRGNPSGTFPVPALGLGAFQTGSGRGAAQTRPGGSGERAPGPPELRRPAGGGRGGRTCRPGCPGAGLSPWHGSGSGTGAEYSSDKVWEELSARPVPRCLSASPGVPQASPALRSPAISDSSKRD